MAKKDSSKNINSSVKPKKTGVAVNRATKNSTTKRTKKIEDTSKQVAIDVKKLTEQDAEEMLDKIVTGTKNKSKNSRYYLLGEVDSIKEEPVKKTLAERREAKRAQKANEKARQLKREASRRAAELREIAERQVEEIRLAAEREAAEIKMRANEKAVRLNRLADKKAIKRELKETIKRAKLEAAIKLGKPVKSKPDSKKADVKKVKIKTTAKKATAPKLFIKTFIAASVVGVLVLAAGFVYTWYMGQGQPKTDAVASVQTDQQVSKQPEIKHVEPAANAAVGAAVQLIESPVAAGNDSSLTIRTNPGAKCDIKVEYNKIPSNAEGLHTKTADEFGIVSWSWYVGTSVPAGKWPVTVTCSKNGKSGVVTADLVVTRS